jgi:hypothetical protein
MQHFLNFKPLPHGHGSLRSISAFGKAVVLNVEAVSWLKALASKA